LRVTLAKAWPGLAYHFGLYPDDIGRFSTTEWNRYLDALTELSN